MKTNAHAAIDWEHRRRVILEVQAAGGTASDAAVRLDLTTESVLKTSRRLGLRFPQRNRLVEGRKATAVAAKPKESPNAGTAAVAAQNKTAWAAYHQRRRFAKALREAPEQPFTDAELIERAVADGKVTRVDPGSGLIPLWLSGAVDNCVKPRAGASKGARA